MAEQEKGNKKYTIVDKRFNDLDDVEESAPAEEEPETPSEPEAAPEPEPAPEPEAKQEPVQQMPQDAPPDGAQYPEQGIDGAMRMTLNMLRERALLSLGLLISKSRPKDFDLEKVGAIANVFGAMTEKFMDKLGQDELGDEDRQLPGLEETIIVCFNILQGQILVYMGLVANPATGLIAKDLDQAKTGIDFYAELYEQVKSMLDEQVARDVQRSISDLKMNFVNQLGQ